MFMENEWHYVVHKKHWIGKVFIAIKNTLLQMFLDQNPDKTIDATFSWEKKEVECRDIIDHTHRRHRK